MNKINDIGMQLIEFKEEYSKDYSTIIIDALSLSMDQLVKSKIVDRQAIDLVKNKNVNMDNFTEFLLDSPKYSKTEEEIEKEMDKIREEFDKELINEGLIFDTKTIIENESFFLLKAFSIDVDFIINFFGVKKSDLGKLMEKKGFIEKFAALRLTQVAKEISTIINTKNNSINLKTSLVYFNLEETGFAIDLIHEVKFKDLQEIKEDVLDDLRFIDRESETLFKKKMQFHGMDERKIV